MAKKDYYDVLGVERGADEKAIKRAYKNSPCNITLIEPKVIKPKKKNLKKSKKPMKLLGDKEKRAAYDQYGHAAFEQGGMGGSSFGGGFSGADFGDIFGDMFGDIFGGGGRSRQRVVRGEDLRYDIQITLEEAVKGTTKDIQINTLAHCDSCDGTGAEKGSKVETCPSCHGSGRIRRQQRFLCD